MCGSGSNTIYYILNGVDLLLNAAQFIAGLTGTFRFGLGIAIPSFIFAESLDLGIDWLIKKEKETGGNDKWDKRFLFFIGECVGASVSYIIQSDKGGFIDTLSFAYSAFWMYVLGFYFLYKAFKSRKILGFIVIFLMFIYGTLALLAANPEASDSTVDEVSALTGAIVGLVLGLVLMCTQCVTKDVYHTCVSKKEPAAQEV